MLLSSVSVAASGESLMAPPPRLIPIAVWVNQLPSKDASERDKASQQLSGLALDPPPEFIALTISEDPELRERAIKVAQAMRWNVAANRLARGQKFIDQDRIDLFVAATAVWDLKPDDPRLWEPEVELGRKLIEKAEMRGARKPQNTPSSYRDFSTYLKAISPQYTRIGQQYTRENTFLSNDAIQAAGIAIHGGICKGSLLVCMLARHQKLVQNDTSRSMKSFRLIPRSGIAHMFAENCPRQNSLPKEDVYSI